MNRPNRSWSAKDKYDVIKPIINMEKVVKLAKKITAKGKICLLSPAAPSYNKYKNFEEKGKLYKEYVRNK